MPTINLKSLLLNFSNADTLRLFNFTSGHVGALPIQGLKLSQLLILADKSDKTIHSKVLFATVIRVILEAIFPIGHLKITCRVLLRKFQNGYTKSSAPSLIVFSLGANTPKNDAYFGKLLAQINHPFLYITNAGGNLIKTKNSQLVEGLLTNWQLCLLCIMLPFFAPFFIFHLLLDSLRIANPNHRRIFIYFGMLEIISSSTLSQQISIFAITQFLKRCDAKAILFPMEGRNWEKSIVKTANIEGMRSIGYLHCALTPRHLSLLNNTFIKPSETPSSIYAPSMMAFNQLKKGYGDIVRKGFFLRGSNEHLSNTSSNTYILFALIGDIAEAKLIINKIVNLQKEVSVPIKISLNRNTSSFKDIQKLVMSSGLKIYDPVTCGLPKVCFFRSSSVAIDFMKRGVCSVYLDLNEPISNNIFELDAVFNIESLNISDISNITVRKYLMRNQLVDWSKIALYYLDENYSPQDLNQLLLTEFL